MNTTISDKEISSEKICRLTDRIIAMGALCEVAIASAAKALTTGDTALASKALESDKLIDDKEREIETLCLKLLLEQPAPHELRQISAALKMITDMERIGDQAADIAEIVTIAGIKTDDNTVNMDAMARATIKKVTDSIDAYVSHNLELARKVIAYDDVVDDFFTGIKESLITLVAADPSRGSYILDLLMIAKYLERIGDHAVNIAEWVEFSITGEHYKK